MIGIRNLCCMFKVNALTTDVNAVDYLFAQVFHTFSGADTDPPWNLRIIRNCAVFLRNGKIIPCSAKSENFEEKDVCKCLNYCSDT